HALLHVSWTEGLPQVLFEAFAARLPVVATAVGGVPAAAGDCAILVEPGDATAPVTALERIRHDPELRLQLTDAGARKLPAKPLPDTPSLRADCPRSPRTTRPLHPRRAHPRCRAAHPGTRPHLRFRARRRGVRAARGRLLRRSRDTYPETSRGSGRARGSAHRAPFAASGWRRLRARPRRQRSGTPVGSPSD